MRNTTTHRILAIAAALAIVLTPTAAHASEVIAQDLTITSSQAATTIAAQPNGPNSLVITAAPGASVKLKAAGTKSRTVTTNKKGTAVVKKLVAGRTYTISSGKESVSAVPVVPVTGASGLRVATTETPGNVELTWKHTTTPAQGVVKYQVTAEPINSKQLAVTGETTQQSFVLIGLDLATRYQFTVTPVNALGAGTPSTAVMANTLGEITGKSVVEQSQPTPAPTRTTTPTQNTQPAPAPAPAPTPATRTIYVCPDGFSENGNLCEKTMAYTYTTIAYTFHDETRTESCWGADCPGSVYRSYPVSEMAPHCPQGGTIHGNECAGWTDGSRQVTYQVKDTTPAGFTDNGTAWVKKNDLPAGYTDNGTAWVQIVAKEARVVPA
jgi:hypothetical protein